MNGRIGASPQRVGGHGRVTGLQEYLADIRLPDVLEAKLVTLDCRPSPDRLDRHERGGRGSPGSASS